jgi:NitT/TauT family transport system substrate-binding protein
MKKNLRTTGTIFGIIWIFIVSSGCLHQGSKPDDLSVGPETSHEVSSLPLKKVRLLPYWITTAQFAGYYVGKEQGIFRKYGIDLEIIRFEPYMNANSIIANGEADFFLMWLVNAIELKASGVNLVNIAQLSTRSSLMLLVKKSSGITRLEEMNGEKAGIWAGYELQPRSLFKKYNLDVEIVLIGSTNNLFLADGVQITNANWFDEYHAILNSGYDSNELRPFFFYDYGLNFLEDGIYCMSGTKEKDPELCKAFVDAALESWKYVFSHPETSVNSILAIQKEQNQPANLAHQRWMLSRYRDLYYPGNDSIINTNLKESDYQNIAGILLDAELIGAIPDYTDFFRPVSAPPVLPDQGSKH